MVEQGYGDERDAECAEAGGRLEGAEPERRFRPRQGARRSAARHARQRQPFPGSSVVEQIHDRARPLARWISRRAKWWC